MTDTSSLLDSFKRTLLFIAYMVLVSLIASGLTMYGMHSREIAARVAFNRQLATSDSAISALTDSLTRTTDALHTSMGDVETDLTALDAALAAPPRVVYVPVATTATPDSAHLLATAPAPAPIDHPPDSTPAIPASAFHVVADAAHGLALTCSRLLHDCAANDSAHIATEAAMRAQIDQLRIAPPRVDTVETIAGISRWKHDLKLIGLTALTTTAVCGVANAVRR